MIRGVLGGSFDPVHNGHVAMARYVLENGLARQVRVVPARLSPHKSATSANAEHRVAMARLAFADLLEVVVDERETHRSGPSYTVDTLAELTAEFPDDRLLLIIGQDNVAGLSSWREPERIGSLARLAVLARRPEPGAGHEPPEDLPPGLHLTYHEDFHQPVSSRRIRAILTGTEPAAGELAACLPPAVLEYIGRHRLYRV